MKGSGFRLNINSVLLTHYNHNSFSLNVLNVSCQKKERVIQSHVSKRNKWNPACLDYSYATPLTTTGCCSKSTGNCNSYRYLRSCKMHG